MSGFGLHFWLVLGFAVVLAIVVTLGWVWLGIRLLPAGLNPVDHNPTISPFITVVGLVYGALLSFTVVATWEQFSATQVVVASEASSLTTMYRQTVAMPEPERSDMQQLLRKYAAAVAGPEWNRQGNDGARAAITRMFRVAGSQQPSVASKPINVQFLNQLASLASSRNERISGTKPRIPPLLWAGLIFGAVVLVGLVAFLRLGSTTAHIVLTCAVAFLLSLLLSIVFTLDHSFAVDQRVIAAPFNHALVIFDAVDSDTRYFQR